MIWHLLVRFDEMISSKTWPVFVTKNKQLTQTKGEQQITIEYKNRNHIICRDCQVAGRVVRKTVNAVADFGSINTLDCLCSKSDSEE